MVQTKPLSPQPIGWACAFVAASAPLTTAMLSASVGLANAPSYETFAKNAKVRVHSSNSMASMNRGLKEKFEGKFSGASVNVKTVSAKQAVEDVEKGNADIAAIGRPLTAAEKAKGLKEVVVGRDKIAIVVGPNNPFKKDLSIPKFARMFRGEVTNWSEIGGSKAPIVFVDRLNSDTRQAIASYPQFKERKLESGKNAVKLESTSMEAVEGALKTNGVSFVSANQTKSRSGLRAVKMDGVLPTDPRYPFSQPLYYVYKDGGNGMNNNAKAFIGFLGTSRGQTAAKLAGISPAPKAELAAASGTTVTEKPSDAKAAEAELKAANDKVPGSISGARGDGTPSNLEGKESDRVANNAIQAETDGNFFGLPFPSWLRWLLPLGLLGMGLLLLLMPRKGDRDSLRFEDDREPNLGNPLSGAGTTESDVWAENAGAPYIQDATDVGLAGQAKTAIGDLTGAGGAAAAGVAAGVAGAGSAAWNFVTGQPQPPDPAAEFNTPEVAAPTFDAPNINLTAPATTDFSVSGQEWNLEAGDSLNANLSDTTESASTPTSNFFTRLKDTAANLADGVTQAGGNVGAAAAGAAAAGAAAIGGTAASARTRLVGDKASIVLVPQTAREAVVRWQLTEGQKNDARNQGGIDLALRLYDVTGIDPDRDPLENFYQYDCSELTQELRIEVPVPARDYVVEVGYLDRAGEWIGVARSMSIHIPAA